MNKEVRKNKFLLQGFFCLALVLATILAACEKEEACISLLTNQYRTGFSTVDEQGRVKSADFHFERIWELKSDSTFYTRGEAGLSSLLLAFNPAADTAVFVFDYAHRNAADTLKLRYRRNFEMISPDCGLEVGYSHIQIASHTFDSVRVFTSDLMEPAENVDVTIYSKEECILPATNWFQMDFLAMNKGRVEREMVSFELVRALGTQHIFYSDTMGEVNALLLALNPEANNTTFIFEQENDENDTLRLTYVREFEVTSAFCPMKINFRDLEVDHTTFGQVKILRQGREGLDMEVFLENPCEEPTPNPYRVGFFRHDEQGEKTPETVNFDEVGALGSDALFYSRTEEGINSLELLLNPEADSTAFIFEGAEMTDTLTVAYTRNFVVQEPMEYCDPFVAFTNLTIKYHTFTQVVKITEELNEGREGFDLEIYQ